MAKSQWHDGTKTTSERGYGYAWKKLRKVILQRDAYLCQECYRRKKLTPATDVDHIVPKSLGGTDDEDNLQSLCKECHKFKSLMESGNKPSIIPNFQHKPSIPVTIICGPSGAGKSTYATKNAAPTDLIVDLDDILVRISGQEYHTDYDRYLSIALLERNSILGSLANNHCGYTKCWLIVGAPTYSERRKWKESLNAEVIVLMPPEDVCKERVKNRDKYRDWDTIIDTWFHKYSQGRDETVIRS